jgi:hypothetical protein
MRPRFRHLPVLFVTLLAAALAPGCASPLTSALSGSNSKQERTPSPAEVQAAEMLKAQAVQKASSGGGVSEDQAFAEILDQLQEIRAIDPEAERELIAELKQVKPENYAMVVDAFGTALAYRQQLAERDRKAFAGESPLNEFDVATQQLRDRPAGLSGTQLRHASISGNSLPPASLAAAHWPPSTHSTNGEGAAAVQVSSTHAGAVPAVASESAPPRAAQSHIEQASAIAPIAQRPSPSARPLTPVDQVTIEPADAAAVASDAQSPSSAPLPGSPISDAIMPVGWQSQLEAAITDLERTVAPQPASVTELHDHMKLRTLQLLAGREQEAYRAIPGASPAQQDYWSKQLFAINAYLNATTTLDEKQRAVSALASLDEARARLSELASLRLRNLSFVHSVDGFGVYEPSASSKFVPGQTVMLYAEVENFTSSASEGGFTTSLGTSFKVLDEGDRLVDGKQFPDVQDSCRNRRRDFHMQYELALPTRIYPGPYKIELTITDHHSGKIGQATLPFEIVDDGAAKTSSAATTKK